MKLFASFARNRRSAAIVSIALAAIVFLALNTAANIWFRSARLDLTENGLYTISDGTKNILRGLKEPVTLRLYYSAEQAADYPNVRAYAQRIRDLLDEYRSIAGANLVVEEIDPAPFSAAEDQAISAGLQARRRKGAIRSISASPAPTPLTARRPSPSSSWSARRSSNTTSPR